MSEAKPWPLLVRALLAVEWAYVDWDEGSVGPECQGCSDGPCFDKPPHHVPGCTIDAALSSVGLDTAEKRDAARAEIARMAK